MLTGRKIVHNTTFLMASSLTRKLLSFLYFALIARHAGIPTTGLYFLMISFATLFTALMDFGLSPTFIRGASQKPESLQKYLNNVLGMKLILCLIASFTGILLISILDYPTITRQLVYIVTVMMILESFAESFYACLRVKHHMEYESFGMVGGQVLTLLFGGFALWRQWPIHMLVVALVLNQLFNFVYSFYIIRMKFEIRPGFSINVQNIRPVVMNAIPFFVLLAFDKLNSLDTLILSSMADDKILGIYSIPSTIFGTFFFIPLAVVGAIYPALSSFHITSKDKLLQTFENAYFLLFSFILPAVVGIWVLAGPIIRYIFGIGYGEAVLPLQWLCLSLVPVFLNYLLGALLNACNRHVANMTLMSISTFFHLLLAFLLIPRYQVMGLVFATLVGHVLFYLMSCFTARGLLGLNLKDYFFKSLRILAATLIMGLVLTLIKDRFHVMGLVALGIIVYAAGLVVVQGFGRDGFHRDRAFFPWIDLSRQFRIVKKVEAFDES